VPHSRPRAKAANDWESELVSYAWAIPERGLMLYTGDWFGAKALASRD
jgi:hypothetical protein